MADAGVTRWRRLPLRTVAAALVLLALLAAAIALGAHPRRGADLHVYLVAADRFLEGAPLYRTTDGHMPFKYAPATAALFVPLTLLPDRLARIVWNLTSAAAFFAAVLGVLRLAGRPGWKRAAEATALAAVVLAHPLVVGFDVGQVDVVLLSALVWAHVLAQSEKRLGAIVGAGALCALAVLLKPPVAFFGLLWLRERRWKALAAAAVAGLALQSLVLLRYGGAGSLELTLQWMSLVEETTLPWVMGHNPQGLPTVLLDVLGVGDPPEVHLLRLAQLLSLGLLGGALFLSRARGVRAFGLACLGGVLVSPLAWRANFVLALPLVLAALFVPPGVGRLPGRGACLALALVGAVLTEGLWEPSLFRTLMETRPFALAGLALFTSGAHVTPRCSRIFERRLHRLRATSPPR